MKPRTIILLVVAVVCGLAAMYMTNRLLAGKGDPAPVNTVKVLVSKQKVSAYTPIKKAEDLFELKDVPEGTYSPKCIADLKQLQGKALRRDLDEQMPVTPDDLFNDATSGIIGKLTAGQRAVAIRVTPESLVGGFVLPGSKVDVMFIKKRGDADSDTQIILQDMLVLAVDQKNTKDAEQQSMLGSTATLAATPEEAENLALCASLGDLRLLLRTPLDTVQVKSKPFNISNIGHQQRAFDPNKPGATDTDTAQGGNSGGTAPNVGDTKPDPKPEVKTAPEKVAETTKAKQFEMVVENGDDVTSFVFTRDEKDTGWLKDRAAKTPDALKPEDAPKPQPKAPAPAQDKGSAG